MSFVDLISDLYFSSVWNIISYYVLSRPVLSYPILSYPILSYILTTPERICASANSQREYHAPKRKDRRMTALVFIADFGDKLQRLQWIPGL